MTRHDSNRSPSDGEAAIGLALRRLKIKYVREKKIEALAGDEYPYRSADFYLPEYDKYIEFLGMWDTPDSAERAKARERYNKKKQIYADNNIRCLYIYPKQLHYVRKQVKDFIAAITPSEVSSPTGWTGDEPERPVTDWHVEPYPPSLPEPQYVPLIIKIAIVLLLLVLAAHVILSSFVTTKYWGEHPSKQQPSLPAVPTPKPPTTLEGMWDIIKIGESAAEFDKQAQTPGFELVDPPWHSPHLEHFEIRKTNSTLDVIHVYFNSQAYDVSSASGRIDPTLPNDGISWSPTTATIYRKKLFQNGTQIRTEP